MELTSSDKKAIKEKLENPDKKVLCPRCGKELLYIPKGNSISIECPTVKCIYGGLRGL